MGILGLALSALHRVSVKVGLVPSAAAPALKRWADADTWNDTLTWSDAA